MLFNLFKKRRKTQPKSTAQWATMMEALENRSLMSTYVVPTSIAFDGSAEVTQAINDFLATVPDGTASSPNTILFQTKGTYWIDGTLGIANRNHLIIDGEGSRFEARDPIDPVINPDLALSRSQWAMSNSTFITLTDMTIVGADPAAGSKYYIERESQHCIAIFGGNHDIMVDSVTAGYCFGDAFYATSDSYNLTLQNSHLEHMDRQGVAIVDNHNVVIRNNYIGDATRTLMDFEPLTENMRVDHVSIIGNTTGQSGNAWLQLAAGKGWIGSVFIADNIINGTHGLSIVEDLAGAVRRGPLILLNNTASIVKEGLLEADKVDGVIVLGNDVTSTIARGVTVSNGHGAIVGNNRGINTFVDTSNLDGWVYNNIAMGDPSFTRDATFTELGDAYGITATNVSVNGYTNATVKVLMRKSMGDSTLSWDGITMTGDIAVVLLDASGDRVDGWTRDLTASYQGLPLPVTGIAPAIATQPAPSTVVTGQSATFNVFPDGPALGYQWFKNGVLIPDATGSSYTTPATVIGDSGTLYTVTVTNRYGASTSAAAGLTVQAAAIPVITTNPIAKTVGAGNTTTFSVTATGPGTLTYQWQKNGVNITGANDDVYVLPPALLADNGALIRCVVTNATGSTNSAAATLSVVSIAFSETFTGSNGAAWPAQWTTSGANVAFTINSNMGRAQNSPSKGSEQIGFALVNTANLTDSDQTTTFRFNDNVGNGIGLVARRADAAPDTFYYTVQTVTGSTNRLYVYKSVAGVSTSYGYVTVTNALEDQDYKLRLVVSQTTDTTTSLKVKMWSAAVPEPDAWANQITDTTPELQNVAGRSGIRFITASARSVSVDNYTLDSDLPTSSRGVAAVTDSFTAADNSPWPAQWTTSGSSNIAYSIVGNMGRALNTPYTGSEQIGFAGVNSLNLVDSDQTATFRFNDNLGGFGLIARQSDANPTTFYYTLQTVSGNINRLYVYKCVNGVSTSLGYANVTSALEDQTYKVRLAVETNDSTTSLKVKMWSTSITEPDAWAAEYSDATPELQNRAGRSGMRFSVASGRSISIDDYSLDTDLPGVTPIAPSALTALLQSSTHTRLTWVDNSTFENGFVVQRSLDNSTWKDLAWLDPNSTAYTDTGLTANTRYFYRVKAYNAEGFSANTAAILAATPDNLGSVSETWTGANNSVWPTKWTFEGATAQTASRVITSNRGVITGLTGATGRVLAVNNAAASQSVDQTVTFNINTASAGVGLFARRADTDTDTYYYAYVQASSATAYIYKVVDGVATQLLAQAITAPSTGTDYKLRFSVQTNGASTDLKLKVWQASASEPGAYNGSVSDSTAALQNLTGRFGLYYVLNNTAAIQTDNYSATYANKPSSPGTLTGVSVSPTQNNLSWTDSSNLETGYIIERTINPRLTTGWTQIGSVAAGVTSFSDNTVTDATRYWYRVVAVNLGGRSDFAPIASVVTQDLPNQVKESFYGPDYEGWGPKWTLDGALSTALSIGNYNGVMKMTAKNSGGTGTIFATYNQANAIDSNMTAKFSLSSNGAGFGLVARRADGDNDTYYYADVVNEGATSRVRIYKVVDGNSTSLAASAAFAYTAGVTYQLRFAVTTTGASTSLQAKVWDSATAEPGTWSLSISDSTARLQNINGRIGSLLKMMTNGRTIYIDDFFATYA